MFDRRDASTSRTDSRGPHAADVGLLPADSFAPALSNKKRKRHVAPPDEDIPGLQQHLDSLALPHVDAYRRWCRSHGFARNLHKGRRQREHELAARRVETSGRRPEALILPALRGEPVGNPPPEIQNVVRRRAALATNPERLQFTDELLHHLATRYPNVLWQRQPESGARYLDVILRVLDHSESAIRAPKDFRCTTKSPGPRIGALLRHLFAVAEIPAILDRAWFEDGPDGPRLRSWFCHAAAGKDLRHADLPIVLDDHMARFVWAAPDDLTVREALRWAQIRGLGGTAEQAASLRGTILAEDRPDDAAWTLALRFLLTHAAVAPDRYGPILAALESAHEVRCDRAPILRALDDGDAAGVLAATDAWQQRPPRDRSQHNTELREITWPASGVRSYDRTEAWTKPNSCWRIEEVRTAEQLAAAGKRFCFAARGIAEACVAKSQSVWTLTRRGDAGLEHRATMQVWLNAQPLLAGAVDPMDHPIGGEERDIILAWANLAGLRTVI